jgi:hypothetical protein
LLADRVSRCRLMVAAETLRALSLLALLAMVLSGQLSIAGLALLGFIGAVGTVCFSVAAPALVPAIVPREALARANGRLELARSMAFAGGPALAGALVAWAGASAAFVLAAILSASAAGLLFSLREPARTPATGPPRAARDSRRRAVCLAPALFAAHGARRHCLEHRLVCAAGGLCALRGARAGPDGAGRGHHAGRLRRGHGAGRAAVAACGGGHAFRPRHPARPGRVGAGRRDHGGHAVCAQRLLAGTAFFLFGVGPIVWTITSTTLRQSVTPHAMLGRVSAVFLAVNAGSRPSARRWAAWWAHPWAKRPACGWRWPVSRLQAGVIFASQLHALRQLPEPVA